MLLLLATVNLFCMDYCNVTELLRRIDTSQIYPPFLALVKLLVQNCHNRKADYYATNGLRSFEDQAAKYALGRTTGEKGHIVTKAPPGYSAHQYGVAIDFCFDADLAKPGLQPGWDIKDYKILAEEAVKLGLDAAYYWQSFKEGPHVQLNLRKYGIEWPKLIEIIKKNGLNEVWNYLDQYKW